MKRLLAPVVLLVAACSSAYQTPAPTSAAATPTSGAATPTSAPAAVLTPPVDSNEEMAAEAGQYVDVLYCGADPKPAWCKILHRVKGVPDVVVDGATVVLVTTAGDSSADRKLGDQACTDLTTMTRTIGWVGIWDRFRIRSAKPGVYIGDCSLS